MNKGILADKRVRTAIVSVGATLAVLLITQVLLPKGTPIATMFQGLVTGLLNALLAVSIVIVYRSQRIVNFAAAALGAAGGVFTYNLAVFSSWPYLLAFFSGVLVAIGLGMAVEVTFIRRFYESPRLVLTVITIALIPAFQQAAGFVNSLPIFRNSSDRSVDQLAGRSIKLPFAKWDFQLGDLPLKFGFGEIFAIAISIGVMVGVALFFRRSRTGVAIRAAAENAERARLLGISVGSLSLVIWALAGGLGGVSVILTSTVQKQFNATAAPPELLVIALSAAVFAKMKSLPAAAGAAILISVLRESVQFHYQDRAELVFLGLFVLLVLSLVYAGAGSKSRRSEESEASSWKATEEARPTPKEMLEVGGIRIARRVLVAIGLLAVLIFPFIVSTRQANLGGYYAIVTIVLLSLTVLTGWTGQASLGQFGFVAIGAVLGGAFTARLGFSFWLAILIVPFATAAVTLLIGIPALRIKGLYLAIVTYAMAFAIRGTLFEERYFSWLLPGRVDRPSLFVIDFEDERSMYYLCIVALVICIVMVNGLRRTRPGRVMIGLRDNENNVRAFGINPVRMRLTAFAVSGWLCGFAGVLLAHHQRAAQADSFPAQLSLDLFLYAVVGGVGSTFGVVLGGIYFAARDLIGNPALAFVVGPLGIVALLYAAPGGLASLTLGLRDGVLRIVAQRRQMVVPSLFADYDPTAIERRLIPLTEPIPAAGLNALPPEQRYKSGSRLYGLRGRLAAAQDRRREETAAFGAAARQVTDQEDAARLTPTAEATSTTGAN